MNQRGHCMSEADMKCKQGVRLKHVGFGQGSRKR